MTLSLREFWTVFHGMGVGAVFLLAFAGGLAQLMTLRSEYSTAEGIRRAVARLKYGMWTMAIVCWVTVVSGTFIVYPWYRAKSPTSPRSLLVADPARAAWHTFGMEWKEHVAWVGAILATAAAALVVIHGIELARNKIARRYVSFLFIAAFATAAVAGLFGAFLNKVAPI